MCLGNDFLNMTFKAQATKLKNKQMGLHQNKNLLHSKGNQQQNETNQPTKWEKIFANQVLTLIRG